MSRTKKNEKVGVEIEVVKLLEKGKPKMYVEGEGNFKAASRTMAP